MAKGKQLFTCDDELTFGKYRGRTVAWVLREDPQYIQWCVENVTWFDIDPSTEEIMKEALESHKDRKTSTGYSRRDGVEYSSGRESTYSRNNREFREATQSGFKKTERGHYERDFDDDIPY